MNCLPFAGDWVHPRFGWGLCCSSFSLLCCLFLFCLSSSCVLCIQCCHVFPFLISPSVFSHLRYYCDIYVRSARIGMSLNIWRDLVFICICDMLAINFWLFHSLFYWNVIYALPNLHNCAVFWTCTPYTSIRNNWSHDLNDRHNYILCKIYQYMQHNAVKLKNNFTVMNIFYIRVLSKNPFER